MSEQETMNPDELHPSSRQPQGLTARCADQLQVDTSMALTITVTWRKRGASDGASDGASMAVPMAVAWH